MSRPILALFVFALGAAPALSAQGAPPTPPTAADSARAALAAARSDLRNLMTAQEAFYADNRRYAAAMEQIKGFIASRGNTIKIVNAEPNAYAAVLSSVSLKGTCTTFVGLDKTKAVKTEIDKRIGEEGSPVCDRQPAEGPPPPVPPR